MVVKDNEWLDHCTCDDLTARNCICDLKLAENHDPEKCDECNYKWCLQVFHVEDKNYGELRWFENEKEFHKELKRLNKKYGYENVFVIHEGELL